ncbi:hypothetical protein [Roseibaca sp. Y0-43]|uniref:hypothetical protein n=1 Tax=Roseibaca sp. Y0-43 TaxID=2816854 RepID=UPI001D0C0973|nr:hypothetical protein [Roseibaca sp. Y0-43]MCC1482332.1 hypothetical protein [Roseibaca sp. Y0-43]
MRLPLVLVAVGLLSACTSNAPYSNVIDTAGSGVGFSDYAQYMRAQEELSRIRRAEAAAARTALVPPADAPAQVAFQPQGFGNAQTQMPQQAPLGQPVAASPLQSQPLPQQVAQSPAQSFNTGQTVAAAAPAPAEAGVSTQSYQAQPFGTPIQNRVVRRDYVPQVRVTEAEAPAASGPNLFMYALSTQHNVGQERYTRRNPFRWNRWEAACAQYPHQDLAQEAFLAAGGPERDPDHMDPDGDGFACWWDPAPFRQAASTVKARE